jgi:hypothetical protein
MQNQDMQLASPSYGEPESLCFIFENNPSAFNSHYFHDISQTEQFYLCMMNIFVLELNFVI